MGFFSRQRDDDYQTDDFDDEQTNVYRPHVHDRRLYQPVLKSSTPPLNDSGIRRSSRHAGPRVPTYSRFKFVIGALLGLIGFVSIFGDWQAILGPVREHSTVAAGTAAPEAPPAATTAPQILSPASTVPPEAPMATPAPEVPLVAEAAESEVSPAPQPNFEVSEPAFAAETAGSNDVTAASVTSRAEPTPATEPTPTAEPTAPASKPLKRRTAAARRFGQLNLLSIPGGEVYWKGRLIGHTPLREMRLPTGRHRLRIETENDYTTVTVRIRPGRTTHETVNWGIRRLDP